MKKFVLLGTVLFALSFFFGCSESIGTDSELTTRAVSFNITISDQTPSNASSLKTQRSTDIGTLVTAGKIRLNRKGTDLVRMLNMTIANGKAQATSTDLLVGEWTVMVQLYDKENIVIYSGKADLKIFNGYTTQDVNLTLYRHQGSVLFDITLPTEQSDEEDPMFGLIFWNKMDDADSTANSAYGPGLVVGPNPQFSTGKFGGAIYSSSSVASAFSIPAGILPLNTFTMEFWLNRTIVQDSMKEVLSGENNTGGITIVQRFNYSAQHYTIIAVDDGNNHYIKAKFEHSQIPNYENGNTWNHFAITMDASKPVNDRLQFFYNGTKIDLTIYDESGSEAISASPFSHAIELLKGDINLHNGYGGAMDNLKIYSYARNSFSIAQE